ncbi:MAG: HEAT repeat domain-containing protein [Candidatus Zixiibacteriota bacterium]
MSIQPKQVNESILKTDLNELAHSLVRELAMACKKLAIYGPRHPVALKSLAKPYFHFGKIFFFKRYVNFNLQHGELYVLNIRLKDTVFNSHIIQFMQLRDIAAILFDQKMTEEDFANFMEQFVTRVSPKDRYYQLSKYLEEKNISAIEVNSHRAYEIFEKTKLYRGDVEGDYSIKQFCLNQLGADIKVMVGFADTREERLLENFIDFYRPVVDYILPEKIASIPGEDIRKVLTGLADKVNTCDRSEEKSEYFARIMSIFKLVTDHPQYDFIVEHLDSELRQQILQTGKLDHKETETGKIRINLQNRIEDLLEEFFVPEKEGYDIFAFSDVFQRMLKTGQQGKAIEIISRLTDYLSSPDPLFRQKALDILVSIVGVMRPDVDRSVMDSIVNDVVTRLATRRETYEYSELIWQLFEKCFQTERYDLMAKICTNLAMRRQVNEGVILYDSVTVKKTFENINRPAIIDDLIKIMIKANHDDSGYIKETLIAIGSEEIAFALSQIISHPIRQIRQMSLKILAELGKASLRIFSRIIMDDTWFERDSDRHELPDNKWYVIRNSIFVLGSLRDEEGLVPLRLRISDNDVRIRREIVSALEKIGGDEAVDLLVMMAEDPVQEIRNSAINAIGIIGNIDVVPLLIDIARRNPTEAIRVVTVLGNLGGADTSRFLSGLLEDPVALADITGGRISKDELRLTIIKAIGKLGDKKALESVKNYQENLSTTQKILFKNSPVQRAISEILSKK